jgi:uncharacterized protein (TIGR00255 family)
MIRSMTGFARAERGTDAATLIWELRTVNHRFLEVSLRLPDELRSNEAEFRQAIAATAKRGKVDATLQLRGSSSATARLDIDEAFLDELIATSHDVSKRATARGGSLEAPTALDLLRWPGVIREQSRDTSPLSPVAHEALKEALISLADSRASEGNRMAQLLHTRCRQIEALVTSVRARLPEVHARIRNRLEERLASLSAPSDTNRERLEQEIALLLSKMDVDEELDRLISHVAEVDKALAGSEPAGRRLDFLMQEFNREANTLSSKSQDPETTRAAVDMKVLIEQMREQVQNIE